MKTVRIEASAGYDVVIGAGLLEAVGERVSGLVSRGTAVLVSGERVCPLYGEKVKKSLENAGFSVLSFVHRSGESAKSLETYGELVRFLSANAVSRTDTLLALGGGVTGDLAGFAAATYRRGMNFIQLPTTLLAAVDASVGGKTALNLPDGKNQVGAFYPPRLVLCDTDALATLPPREYRQGCAEIVKAGVLSGEALFGALENAERLDTEEIIAPCVRLKRRYVERDEFDTGERQLLNLGHTVGHAVEVCSGYAVSHGDAVAMGLSKVCTAAAKRGILPADERDRILALLQKCGLPTTCPYSADELFSAAKHDKKNTDGLCRLIVPEGIGRVRVLSMDEKELKAWML